MSEMVAIVSPLHRPTPGPDELLALRHGLGVLQARDQFLIAPQSLALGAYGEIATGRPVIRFADRHFRSVSAYNRLMLSGDFYRRFSGYEYLLIFQPDAFVFQDTLDHWCGQGYDYIGAPWPGGKLVRPHAFRGAETVGRLAPWLNKPVRLFVGNGGLSLRRVPAALETLERNRGAVRWWFENEDAFWGFYSRRLPTETEASRFALEKTPSHYFRLNGNRLPLGCHAWARYEPGFWRDKIPGLAAAR